MTSSDKTASTHESEQVDKPALDLSIVIPLYNERDNVETLYRRLKEVLDNLSRSYEILITDDGSTDGSFQILKELAKQDPTLKVIRFRRNFGQTAAFAAGFDYAQGELVITLDADLQNDPRDIPLLLAELEETGYDVVSGWRKNRQDSFWTRRLPSEIGNFLISLITGIKLHDYGCSLKVYRREVIKGIRLYGELHRFIPAIASWMGVSVREIPVTHHARQHGRSKYGLSRVLKVILDLLTVRFLLTYVGRPMQIFGLGGLLAMTLGIGISAYLAILKLWFHQSIGNRPLLLLGILLIISGIQLITMGLLAELLIRVYYETQNKPIYAIKEIVG